MSCLRRNNPHLITMSTSRLRPYAFPKSASLVNSSSPPSPSPSLPFPLSSSFVPLSPAVSSRTLSFRSLLSASFFLAPAFNFSHCSRYLARTCASRSPFFASASLLTIRSEIWAVCAASRASRAAMRSASTLDLALSSADVGLAFAGEVGPAGDEGKGGDASGGTAFAPSDNACARAAGSLVFRLPGPLLARKDCARALKLFWEFVSHICSRLD